MSSPYWNRALWMLAIGMTSLVIAWLDWLTGRELSFFVFFFIPVGIAAWQLSTLGMLAVGIVGATLWYAADFLAGHTYSTHIIAARNTIDRRFFARLVRVVFFESDGGGAQRPKDSFL